MKTIRNFNLSTTWVDVPVLVQLLSTNLFIMGVSEKTKFKDFPIEWLHAKEIDVAIRWIHFRFWV